MAVDVSSETPPLRNALRPRPKLNLLIPFSLIFFPTRWLRGFFDEGRVALGARREDPCVRPTAPGGVTVEWL
jgi:hypothetical protein